MNFRPGHVDLAINVPLLSSLAIRTIALGLGLGDRFGGFPGPLRAPRGDGPAREETSQIAGKAPYQAPSRHRIAAGRSLHGKEGVDGSSPSEGSAKAPQNGASSFASTCTMQSVRLVWSPLWSLQVRKVSEPGLRSTSKGICSQRIYRRRTDEGGLTGRVDAFGGTIEVASPVGEGTTLLVMLTIEDG